MTGERDMDLADAAFWRALGRTISQRRRAKGLTQEALYRRMRNYGDQHKTFKALAYWEIGGRRMTVKDLIIVALGLQVPVEDLVRDAHRKHLEFLPDTRPLEIAQ